MCLRISRWRDDLGLPRWLTRVLIKGKQRIPWWLSGKESTCQCRRQRFDPWSRKISHTVEQLSLCATTTEPVFQSLGAATTKARMPQSLCSSTREVTEMRSLHTAPREQSGFHNQRKVLAATKTQHSQKINKRNKTSLKKKNERERERGRRIKVREGDVRREEDVGESERDLKMLRCCFFVLFFVFFFSFLLFCEACGILLPPTRDQTRAPCSGCSES